VTGGAPSATPVKDLIDQAGLLCDGGRYRITRYTLETTNTQGKIVERIDGTKVHDVERKGMIVEVHIRGRQEPLCLEGATFDDAGRIEEGLAAVIVINEQRSLLGRGVRAAGWVIEHWKVLTGAGGVVVFVLGFLAAFPGPWQSPEARPSITVIGSPADSVCLEQPLRTGQWDFRVDAIEWQALIATPAGVLIPDRHFLLIYLAATNQLGTSRLPETSPDPFLLLDASGVRYQLKRSSNIPGMNLTAYATEMAQRRPYHSEVGEGQTLNTLLLFDVDPSASDLRLQPHQSNGSIKLYCRG
jgi:hypothetical protein